MVGWGETNRSRMFHNPATLKTQLEQDCGNARKDKTAAGLSRRSPPAGPGRAALGGISRCEAQDITEGGKRFSHWTLPARWVWARSWQSPRLERVGLGGGGVGRVQVVTSPRPSAPQIQHQIGSRGGSNQMGQVERASIRARRAAPRLRTFFFHTSISIYTNICIYFFYA